MATEVADGASSVAMLPTRPPVTEADVPAPAPMPQNPYPTVAAAQAHVTDRSGLFLDV